VFLQYQDKGWVPERSVESYKGASLSWELGVKNRRGTRNLLERETCQENPQALWKTSDINLVHLFFPYISSNEGLETMSSQHPWYLKCIIFHSA